MIDTTTSVHDEAKAEGLLPEKEAERCAERRMRA
jgi:hypothetical protein